MKIKFHKFRIQEVSNNKIKKRISWINIQHTRYKKFRTRIRYDVPSYPRLNRIKISPYNILHTSLLKKLKMSRIKKKRKQNFLKMEKSFARFSTRDAVPRGWAYFTDCYLGAGAHPNMLKEWKRWRAGNMPILLDAFYCRDKRLSCLPLTSPLSPPSPPPPHSSHATRENSRQCHERNLYFSTFHLLNGRETLPLLPLLPWTRISRRSRVRHRPLFFVARKTRGEINCWPFAVRIEARREVI